jgi:hypothetical protein
MSRGAWLVLLAPALAAAAAGGCTSDLVLDLEGKECDSRRSCVDGFVCNERTNRCVRPAELNARDAGPEGSLGGDGGAGSGSGSVGGTSSAASGGAGLGGSGPLGGGGGAVLPAEDAGLDASAVLPDGGCAGRIFRDDDGDGVGDISDAIDGACPQPGWVVQPGDCRDDLEDVFPGQTRFFAEPYEDQTAPGDLSFDYDCSDAEEPDPSNETLDPPPNCANLLGVGCAGSGFLPFSPPRIGANIDARCGSNQLRDCRPETLACVTEDTAVADEVAFRCK